MHHKFANLDFSTSNPKNPYLFFILNGYNIITIIISTKTIYLSWLQGQEIKVRGLPSHLAIHPQTLTPKVEGRTSPTAIAKLNILGMVWVYLMIWVAKITLTSKFPFGDFWNHQPPKTQGTNSVVFCPVRWQTNDCFWGQSANIFGVSLFSSTLETKMLQPECGAKVVVEKKR